VITKIVSTIALTIVLTGCSQIGNSGEPSNDSEKTSATLLTEGCTGFLDLGSDANRSDNISKFRELAKIDSNYFELLRTAVEFDLILGKRSLDELGSLKPEYKTKVFDALTTLQTFCG
jgi:hypothetical protein